MTVFYGYGVQHFFGFRHNFGSDSVPRNTSNLQFHLSSPAPFSFCKQTSVSLRKKRRLCSLRSVIPLRCGAIPLCEKRCTEMHLILTPSYSASGFSTCAIADFCIGIRQFLLFPNSMITVSSVISIIVP